MDVGSREMLRRNVSVALVAVFLGAATAVVAPIANAYTDSNKVHNCFGRYYNTDWDQLCSSPGAVHAGSYKTTAACTLQPDKSMTKTRPKGSTVNYDGVDCTFGVGPGSTSFWQ